MKQLKADAGDQGVDAVGAAARRFTLDDGRLPTFASPVRADYVPADSYVSQAWLEAENRALWPQVWQMACREEELASIGSYVTYDIADETVVVVRTADGIRAYHNVCPHRGRRLTSGCGRTARFHCKFHGWRWNLDGSNEVVVDREDWGGLLSDEDIALTKVHADVWAGFVFISMALEPPPLLDYLGEAAHLLDPFEIGRMRYKWYKSIRLPCNWKVALEAFNEAYHVQTTHRQLLKYSEDYSVARAAGDHSMFWYPPGGRMRGSGSSRLGAARADFVQGLVEYFEELQTTLNAQITLRETELMRRLPDRVGSSATPAEVGAEMMRIFHEAAATDGWEWPPITQEQLFAAGVDWHIFPNMVLLPRPSALLGYRVRPHDDDPDMCLFEVYALERYAEGKQPPLDRRHNDDAGDADFWGLILTQDFQNMCEVQRGMKSSAFKAARPNPVQEVAVSNFHRVLHDYLDRGGQRPCI